MSNILGGLRSFNVDVLSEHLPLLGSGGATFTLQVSDGYSERVIYWTHGRLFILSNGERSGPGVLNRLVLSGKMAAADVEEILKECRKSKASLLEVLLTKGAATSQEFENEMRFLARRELFDLIFWESALFLSYEAPPPPDFFREESRILSAALPPPQLAQDLSSWIRKWIGLRQLVGSDLVKLQAKGEAQEVENGGLSTVLDACVHPVTLRDLQWKVNMELPELCDLLARGIAEHLITVSPEAREAIEPKKAIEKLEKLLPHAVGKDLVRLKLAGLHRKAKRMDKACSCFQQVAEEATARGDWLLACDCLRSLLAIRPEDLRALRHCMKLQMERGLDKQAIALAMQVEASLLKERKAEELKGLAEILGGIAGAELFAQEVRASIRLLAGEVERAIEDYQAIADRHEKGGDPERALQALGKVLDWDPENDELKRRLLRLKQRIQRPSPSAAPRARRGSRAAMRTATLGAAAAACLACLLWYAFLRAPGDPGGHPPAFAVAETEAQNAGSAHQDALPEGPVGAPAGGPSYRPAVIVVKAPAPRPEPPRVPGGGKAPLARPEGPGASGPPAVPVRSPSPAPLPPEGPRPSDVRIQVQPQPTRSAEAERRPPVPGMAGPPSEVTRDRLALRAPCTSEELAARVGPLFHATAPGRPCRRHGQHVETSRILWDERTVHLAHGCFLRIEDSNTGDVVMELASEPGTRWAYDPWGDKVAAWAPGEPLLSFTGDARSGASTTWKMPAGARALALGETTVAVCLEETTQLLRLADGVAICSSPAPPWREGFFAGNRLCLAVDVVRVGGDGPLRKETIDQGTATMVLDANTLQVLVHPKTIGAAAAKGQEPSRGPQKSSARDLGPRGGRDPAAEKRGLED